MPRLPGPDDLGGARILDGGGVPSYGIQRPDTPRPDNTKAEALSVLAKAVGQSSDAIFKVVAKEEERADTVRAEDAFNQLRSTQQDLTLGKENGFVNLRGGDAEKTPILEQWTQKFDDRQRALADGLGNDRQRERFNRRAAVVRTQFQGGIYEHLGRESNAYAESVYKTALDTEIRSVGDNPEDDLTVGLSFVRVADVTEQEAKRLGKSAEEIQLAKEKASDALWVSRLEAWRLRNPVGALKAFQENQEFIGSHTRVRLAESLFRDAAPVLAAELNTTGGPPVPASALATAETPGAEIERQTRLSFIEEQAKKAGGADKLPRGIRNNNPGNVISGPTRWEGEIEGADPRYSSFASPEAGIRAMAKNLVAYQTKGIDTVEGVISRWAPASENETAEYVKTVAAKLGVNPREPLNLSDRKTLTALATAIIEHENGNQPYSEKVIATGIDSALTGKPIAHEAKRTPAFSAASLSNLTAAEALTVTTGNPVVDRLPADQRLAVFQKARELANQGTAQAREVLRQRVQDSTAAYERGQEPPNPPTQAELITNFGQADGERISSDLARARLFGSDVRSVQNLSATQQAALLASRTPRPGDGYADAVRRHEQLARAIDSVAKERNTNPALSVVRNSPQVQAAYKTLADSLASGQDLPAVSQAYAGATLAEQRRLEIANPQILSTEMVDSIAKRFAAPPAAGESTASVMRGMVEQWGRYWPQIGAQLKGKIPPEATVIGLGVTPSAETLLDEAIKLKPEQLRQGIPESEVSGLRARIHDDLEPLRRTMRDQGGGIEGYDNYADATEKLALALMQKGMTPKEASARAVENIVGFKYEFEETWRVPKNALGGNTNLSSLRAGALAAKHDIGSDNPVLGEKVALFVPPTRSSGVRPADAERMWRDTVRANGFWVTSPGDGGLTLYVRDRLTSEPVYDASGKPITRTWEELSTVGNSVRAATMGDVRRRRP